MSNNAPDYENDLVFPPASADVHTTKIEKQLKELLKECNEHLEYHADLIFCELESNTAQKEFKNLLIKINKVLENN